MKDGIVMDVVLIGEGGHSKVIREMIEADNRYEIRAVLDDKYEEVQLQGNLLIGPITAVQRILNRYPAAQFIVAIGNNEIRKKIVVRLGIPHNRYLTLVHQTATISPSASIGCGTVVMAHSVIQADARIGHQAIINTGAIVEHDCQLDNYVHAAPRTTLTGAVHIGEGAMLGAGSTVIPGLRIGEWSVVGAGSTVIRNVADYSMAVGAPAAVIKTFGKAVSN